MEDRYEVLKKNASLFKDYIVGGILTTAHKFILV